MNIDTRRRSPREFALRAQKRGNSGEGCNHGALSVDDNICVPQVKGKISVVMPAYNEAAHIASNLLETVNTLSSAGYSFEVIVVDDGSGDKTYLEAAKAMTPDRDLVRVVHYNVNQGKGNALMCGTWYSRGEIVVFLDADLDLHPSQLPVLFELLQTRRADAVIGSKRHPLSRVQYPRIRRFYSFLYYTMVRLMFGLPIKDTQTGIKVFKREVLESVFPRVLAKRFAFDIEVLANAHRLGYVIVDAPVTLHFKRPMTGRIRIKDAANILVDTLAIFYRMRILRYYDRFNGDLTLADLPVSKAAHEYARQP